MKKKFINFIISIVKKEKDYSLEDIEKMEYALEGIYLTGTKIIIISIIAIIIGITKPYFLFLLFYSPLRLLSFGWHANSTKQCWFFSIIAFIILPYIFSIINISLTFKIFVIIISIINFYFFAPADTKKRPIINKKRRLFFKCSSLSVILIYSFLMIKFNNLYINMIAISMLYQCFCINPIIYKITKQSYNNYKTYNFNN